MCPCVLYPMGSRGLSWPYMGSCDVNGVTWPICSILIGRENFCCALIGYSLKGPLSLLTLLKTQDPENHTLLIWAVGTRLGQIKECSPRDYPVATFSPVYREWYRNRLRQLLTLFNLDRWGWSDQKNSFLYAMFVHHRECIQKKEKNVAA